LLRDLNETIGVPINVFRCDMILAHSHYRGQLNVPDMFTRLLFSVVRTGIAPRSFYTGRTDEAHYDGLPVDFISRAILAISAEAKEAGYSTFHVSNTHWDDGISLDTFMDWIRSAGYPLDRIDDYHRWYRELSDRLARLDAEARDRSSLPILHQLEHPAPAGEEAHLSAERFRETVRRLLGEDIPHLSEGYLHKYLSDMQLLKLIPSPEAQASVA